MGDRLGIQVAVDILEFSYISTQKHYHGVIMLMSYQDRPIILLYKYPEFAYQNISSCLAKLSIHVSLTAKIALPPVRLELTAFRL